MEINKSEDILKEFAILFVEDEADIRERLAVLLKRRVKSLYIAVNGKEGIEQFVEHKPDIVVTDINMPVMNGLEMAEKIKRIDENVPVIVITAYNDQNFFIDSIEIGVDRYILKPVIVKDFLKVITDVAVSLRQKREVELLRKALDDSMRLQSVAQLTKGLSHNFNNILVGIVGYAGLIRMKLSHIEDKEIPEILNYLDTIEKSADRASELIRHLMTFSDRIECEKKDIHINEVVRHVVEIIKLSFPQNIRIETSLSDSLPYINADSNKLEQAILNVCINAKEAMPEGGELKIETFSNVEGIVAIKITDTGCGMDERTKRMMFDPFFTTKGLVSHLGLGLSITMSIIRQHNGFIRVDSAEGKGTVLTIHLPAAQSKT